MFRDASGPLYEFMKSIGRNMGDCGNGTPLEQFVDVSYSSPARTGPALPEWILAHVNELTESDFQVLEKCGLNFMSCIRREVTSILVTAGLHSHGCIDSDLIFPWAPTAWQATKA